MRAIVAKSSLVFQRATLVVALPTCCTCSAQNVGATLVVNTSHLSQKGEREDKKAPIWQNTRKQKNKELSMYRLREMDVDDKVCEQVSKYDDADGSVSQESD